MGTRLTVLPDHISSRDLPCDLPDDPGMNPCLACGACCASFRVSFYWREAEDGTPGGVPLALTEDLDPVYRAMQGTNQRQPRCKALAGELAVQVSCTIYEQRPSPCRDFHPSHLDGTRNLRCDQARLRHGMPPLHPESWPEDGIDPELTPTRDPGTDPDIGPGTDPGPGFDEPAVA